MLANLAWNPVLASTLPLPLHSTGTTRALPNLGAHPHALYGCTINAPNMNFGTYDIFSAAPLTTQDTVTMNCNQFFFGGNVTVSFSTGTSGSYATRTMTNGTNILNYNLYADASHTQILGNGNNGTYTYQTTLSTSFFGPVQGTFTMYGLIPAQQNVSPGTYTDIVVITLNF